MTKSNRLRAAGVIVCAFALGLTAAIAQDTPAPILNHTFEENDGGWHGISMAGGKADVNLTHDATGVKSGKGALKFDYELKKGDFSLLLLPTPDMVLSKAKSLKFWIKADHSTPIGLAMQEKDGGRYSTVFTVQKDTWQQVEVSTADFALDVSKDAPKDPDGKLDLDTVENVALIDMAQIFIQGDDAFATVLGISAGPRTFYLDDFTVNTMALAPGATLKNGEGSLDTFARPQVSWIAFGEVQLSHAAGKPLEGAGLQAKYHQAPAKVCGFSKFIGAGGLTGATKLMLSAASLKPAKIIVQLEEKSGGKYNTTIELPGNSGRADLALNLSDFRAAQDSKDDDNKLDLDQVTQIIFIDGTGLLDNTDADNTFWVNNIKAAK
jgi:hypothetical protein